MASHYEWFRAFLYGSPPRQFVATVVVTVALILLFRLARHLRDGLRERTTRNLAEVAEMLVLAMGIAIAALLLAEIWAIPFVYEQVIDIATVDRWEGVRSALSVALLAIGYLLVRAVTRSFDRLHEEGAITTHQREVADHVAGIAVLGAVVLAVLSVWGISLTNLIVGAGVATAVLGLAAQRTVAAIVAGFFLLFSRPFRVGDWIAVADEAEGPASGIVEDVTISHTKIRTFNDEHVLVPNDQVTANRLTNYTRNDRLRIDVEVDVDYDADLDHACEIACDAVKEVDSVSHVKEPKVVLTRLDDSAVVLEVQFWIEDPARRRVLRARTDVIAAITEAFDREGISIPFPQRSHVPRQEGGFRLDAPSDGEAPTSERDRGDTEQLSVEPGSED